MLPKGMKVSGTVSTGVAADPIKQTSIVDDDNDEVTDPETVSTDGGNSDENYNSDLDSSDDEDEEEKPKQKPISASATSAASAASCRRGKFHGVRDSVVFKKEQIAESDEKDKKEDEEDEDEAEEIATSPSAEEECEQTKMRQRLIGFYRKYNPSMITRIDETLEKYKGQYDLLFEKLEKKYVKVLKTTVKMDNSHGFTATDSMRLIPTFDDDHESDEDTNDADDEEDNIVTRTDGGSEDGASKKDSSSAKIKPKKHNMGRSLSMPLPLNRTVSFGVRPDEFSECKLKGKDLKKPEALTRKISFNETVTLNHVDSFKKVLTSREQEEVWYSDVEMVIMKVDCGMFNQAKKNQQQKQQQANRAAAQQELAGGAAPNRRASTGSSSTMTAAQKKAAEKRAKEMRKKYGIDQKVKDNKKATKASPASTKTTATTDASSKKKKKSGMGSLFGRKKK